MDLRNDAHAQGGDSEQQATAQQGVSHNPIDHIFQFHKALRRELHQIEYQVHQLRSTALDHRSQLHDGG